MAEIDPRAQLDVARLRAPLEAWLSERWPARGGLVLDDFSAPRASGYSNETVFFRARWREDGEPREGRYVARIEPEDAPIFPDQTGASMPSVEVQFRAMEAVAAASALPMAPRVGFEAEPGLLGRPFFVMEFVEGDVLTDNPLYTVQPGFFSRASPQQRRRLIEDGLCVLADLHAIDWEAAGLRWLLPAAARPGLGRQLELYRRYVHDALRGRDHPVLSTALAWLGRELPGDGEAGLSWGDSRPGNMIFSDFACVAVTDWEGVAIAPVDLDLGWWLMFDRFAHEGAGAARLEGEPTREEQRRTYAKLAGREPAETRYFEVFAAMRFAAVMIVNCDRMEASGRIPASMQMALHNPASQILADLLERPYSWMREAGLAS